MRISSKRISFSLILIKKNNILEGTNEFQINEIFANRFLNLSTKIIEWGKVISNLRSN